MAVPENSQKPTTLSERIRVDGVPAEVSLANGKITWTDGAALQRCLVVESEVLGAEVEEGRTVRIVALVGTGSGGAVSCGVGAVGELRRVRRDFVLELSTDESASIWAQRIRDYIDSLGRPKRLFILLNPFGGKRTARKVFDNEVKPLLAVAGICYTLQETQYRLHAQELAHQLDLFKYDGIICVSGDGILVEVLNGLLCREDWQSAIKMPLGIIPAGTGNGMVKSLLDSVGEAFLVSNAVSMIIRGHKRALDVATISQGRTLFFSVLMLCWGLVADIDIESEKFRWLGSARIDIYCLLRIIKLRKYEGHVSFVPAPGYESYGSPVKRDDNLDILNQSNEDNDAVQRSGYQGPLTCFKSSEWRSIEGPFVSVWLHNVPWANNEAIAAPDAKFSDGYYDLIMIKDCPKSALVAFFLGLSDGRHVKLPHVMYLKVKAFRLEPGERVGERGKGGIVDSDGEVLARGKGTYLCDQGDLMTYGPILLQVEQGLATIFSP